MENLTIITKTISVHAEQEINGNAVQFNWMYEDGELPKTVNFSMARGKIGDTTYMGNIVISGGYYSQGKYDFNNNFEQAGDEVLYYQILAICKSIVNPQTNEE